METERQGIAQFPAYSLLKLPFLTGTKPLSPIHYEITLKNCVLNSSVLKHDLGKPELKQIHKAQLSNEGKT